MRYAHPNRPRRSTHRQVRPLLARRSVLIEAVTARCLQHRHRPRHVAGASTINCAHRASSARWSPRSSAPRILIRQAARRRRVQHRVDGRGRGSRNVPEPLPLVSHQHLAGRSDRRRSQIRHCRAVGNSAPDPDAGTDLATVTDQPSTLLPDRRSSVPAVSRARAAHDRHTTVSSIRPAPALAPSQWVSPSSCSSRSARWVWRSADRQQTRCPSARQTRERVLMSAARNGGSPRASTLGTTTWLRANIIETDPCPGDRSRRVRR